MTEENKLEAGEKMTEIVQAIEKRRAIEQFATKAIGVDLTGEPLITVKGDKDPAWDNMQCAIVVGADWEGEPANSSYKIPLTNREIENQGKCRLMVDFASIQAAETFISENFQNGNAAMFMVDAITQDQVPADRTFIVRRPGGMPRDFQLHKITVTVERVGGNKNG